MTLVAFIDDEHLEGVLVEFDERGATFMRPDYEGQDLCAPAESFTQVPQPGLLDSMGGKLAMLPIGAA